MHVISPVAWVSDAIAGYSRTTGALQPCVVHDGLSPVDNIKDDDALWIAPELLVALNSWLARIGRNELMLEAPADNWCGLLPNRLLGRQTLLARVGDIRSWSRYPAGLRSRPWSQLHRGRVGAFRAARRTLGDLQRSVERAPYDALIELNGHIPCIAEEWCVLVRQGIAEASCGYCVHVPSCGDAHEESHNIRTVFDAGTRFHEAYRTLAVRAAQEAADTAHLWDASVLVAFQRSVNGGSGTVRSRCTADENSVNHVPDSDNTGTPSILEINPVWCTAPYPFETGNQEQPAEVRRIRGARVFLDSIADSRLIRTNGIVRHLRSGRTVSKDSIYIPDSWMSACFSRRYLSFG